jgi:hypothetical protein
MIHESFSATEALPRFAPSQLTFTPPLRVGFPGSRASPDDGLILVRELDERLGFSASIVQHLTDPCAKNTRLPFADLLSQSVHRRMAGDVNAAERPKSGKEGQLSDKSLQITLSGFPYPEGAELAPS